MRILKYSKKEVTNQFHLQENGMEDYKNMCETDQWIHWVLFVISKFLDEVLHVQCD